MLDPQHPIDSNRLRIGETRAASSDRREKTDARRDFRKVMEREKGDDKADDPKEVKEGKAARQASIFDIPTRAEEVTYKPDTTPLTDKEKLEKQELAMAALMADTPRETVAKPKDFHFTPEQGDLSYVNPLAIGSVDSRQSEINLGASEATPMQTTQEIVDQIVEKLYTVRMEGRTETVVNLKGALAGTEVVVTGFDTAHKEFNISFHNLDAIQRNLLEQMNTQTNLQQALLERGYTVHILLMTAEPYQRTITDVNPSETRRDGQQRDDQGDSQQGQKRGRG